MGTRRGMWRVLVLALALMSAGITVSVLAAPVERAVATVNSAGLPDISFHRIPPEARRPLPASTYRWNVRLATGFWLIRDGETWRALSDRSTHMGCSVVWMPGLDRLVDVCQSGTWDRTGLPAYGPAPRGLDWYPVQMMPDGYLEVDLEHPQLDRRGPR